MTTDIDVRLERSDDVVPYDAAALSANERAALSRFAREDDRRAHVAGRSIVRRELARWYDVAPADVPLMCDRYGKPTSQRGPFFSVSHAGDAVAVAFSTRELGIDIEPLLPVDDLQLMIAAYASSSEARSFARIDAMQRGNAFLHMWVRKESVLKASGMGLGTDPSTFDASADAVHLDGRTWRVIDVTVDRHACAIAVDAGANDVVNVNVRETPHKCPASKATVLSFALATRIEFQ